MIEPPDGRLKLTGTVVLVPVKAFSSAKERLSPTINPAARAELARAMATRVLEAAGALDVAVVCDDDAVVDWARSHGALVLVESGRGLNGAVENGVHRLAEAGADEILVTHADLPQAHDLERLTGFDGVTLVPDRREDGTNVCGVPARAGFRFSYGPGSFVRHRSEAERLGLPLRVVREPSLAWDVDVPADLPADLAESIRD